MTFLVKVTWFLLLLICFRANQMLLEKVFDNVTFKRTVTLKKKFQSLVDYVFNNCCLINAVLSKF